MGRHAFEFIEKDKKILNQFFLFWQQYVQNFPLDISDGIHQHDEAYQDQGSHKLDKLLCRRGPQSTILT